VVQGEVKRAETINYRTLKPEKDGLFARGYSGLSAIGNVIAENIKVLNLKVLLATVVELLLTVHPSAEKEWGILN